MVKKELLERSLPLLLETLQGKQVATLEQWEIRRKEIHTLLTEDMYGMEPPFPTTVTGEIVQTDTASFGGKGTRREILIKLVSPFSHASFSFTLVTPNHETKKPVFVYLSFTPAPLDGLGEEILDSGYAFASIYYQDIVPDGATGFDAGLGRYATRNPYTSWGKISMWAFATRKIMDYLVENKKEFQLDISKVAVIGHSRLGKTALWVGAVDPRFSLVVSNNSGAGGAALFRGKVGEQISDLYREGPREWFCGNFFNYKDSHDSLPFDQHFLLSLVAPRNVYITSATLDQWADPRSEFLACVAASPVYELYGEQGLAFLDFPKPNQLFHQGNIGYHMREGTHYLSRWDWQQIIAYRERHSI